MQYPKILLSNTFLSLSLCQINQFFSAQKANPLDFHMRETVFHSPGRAWEKSAEISSYSSKEERLERWLIRVERKEFQKEGIITFFNIPCFYFQQGIEFSTQVLSAVSEMTVKSFFNHTENKILISKLLVTIQPDTIEIT